MDINEVLKHTSAELFIADLGATDKRSALAEMVDTLARAAHLTNRETILQLLTNRESLGSTAVGPQVAFPHGRTLAVQKLIILAARSRAGIPFDSEDGDPTRLFFVLLAPPQDSGHQYIKSLAALTEALQDEGLRDAALEASDYEGFCEALRKVSR